MAQIRRPKKQRNTLVRIFLTLSGILALAIVLFQLDAFPHRKQQRKIVPLTPDKLIAQEFVRKRVTAEADVANVPSIVSSRKFAIELENLVGGQSGTVVIETKPDWAPIGVQHLHKLLDDHFYDGCRFFRVIPNFIVQFGIAGDPLKQKEWRKDVIQDDPVKETNARGTVTYAMAGKNTRTTQLFINTKEKGNAYLDKEGFAPVAVVVEGMEFIDLINSDSREKPRQNQIVARGNAYLQEEFPDLSYIASVREITNQAVAVE